MFIFFSFDFDCEQPFFHSKLSIIINEETRFLKISRLELKSAFCITQTVRCAPDVQQGGRVENEGGTRCEKMLLSLPG
jgi:hypothetical protein